jgi:hypothetical protein
MPWRVANMCLMAGSKELPGSAQKSPMSVVEYKYNQTRPLTIAHCNSISPVHTKRYLTLPLTL